MGLLSPICKYSPKNTMAAETNKRMLMANAKVPNGKFFIYQVYQLRLKGSLEHSTTVTLIVR